MSETDLRCLDTYGQPPSSPVLDWLPLLAGFVAAVSISSMMCPVPRPQTLSGSAALAISTKYVLMIIAASAVAFVGVHAITPAKSNMGFSVVMLQFCGVAGWFAPVLVFAAQRSNWSIWMAAVLAASVTTLIYGYHRRLEASGETPVSGGFIRLPAMISAAFCLQCALAGVVAGQPRPASAAMGVGIALITWFYKSTNTSDKCRARTLPSHAIRLLSAVGFALAFTAAGLTPYLAIESADDGSNDRPPRQLSPEERWPGRPGAQSPQRNLFKAVRAILSALLANTAQHRSSDGDVKQTDTGLSQAAYSALHALFGNEETVLATGPRRSGRPSERNSAPVAIGGSYSGVILWPPLKDYVTIVPPVPRGRVLDTDGNIKRSKPVTIPFFGAYWFFRTSDGGLPPDSFKSRGDPASISFRSTDFTPLSMEARENVGSLIDLNCCKTIQVIITNGDRHPGTVSLELILVNTTVAERPSQSLGKVPVNSTLHWKPADHRLPVTEILSFSIPPHSAIERFDELVIRFELGSPRQNRSAMMAIDRLRFIPRGEL